MIQHSQLGTERLTKARELKTLSRVSRPQCSSYLKIVVLRALVLRDALVLQYVHEERRETPILLYGVRY